MLALAQTIKSVGLLPFTKTAFNVLPAVSQAFYSAPSFLGPNADSLEKMLLNVSQGDGDVPEHLAYEVFDSIGLHIPPYKYYQCGDNAEEFCKDMPHPGPWVAKGVVYEDDKLVTHKTDIGAIGFNIKSEEIPSFSKKFANKFLDTEFDLRGIVFRYMVDLPEQFGGEMFMSAFQDPFFGPSVALGFGGTGIEYLNKIMKPNQANVVLPALYDIETYDEILKNLPMAQFAEGEVRGFKKILDHEALVKSVHGLAKLIAHYSPYNADAPFIIEEIEANPTIPGGRDDPSKVLALDALINVSPAGRRLADTSTKPLDKLVPMLLPKSVAVAGASATDPKKPGSAILAKLVEGGIEKDSIYPIHPKSEEVMGLKTVKSIEDLKQKRNNEPVDLLVVCVPAAAAGEYVMSTLDGDLSVAKSLQIMTGGFGETKKGAELQESLENQLAKLDATPEKRPVINGPNTVGNIVKNPETGKEVSTVFTAAFKSSVSAMPEGLNNAALICQSGAFMLSRMSDLAGLVSPAVALSVGNQMDLSIPDYLEHFMNTRPDLTSYGCYLEGMNDGDGLRLMKLVQRARKEGKFVTFYKAGRSEAGMEAAKGHTASMAGDYNQFATLMEHSGALVADSFEEFNNLFMTAAMCPSLPSIVQSLDHKPLGVAAMSNAGFEKCGIADHLMALGDDHIEFSTLEQSTSDRITASFAARRLGDVVDIDDIIDVTPIMDDSGYDEIMRATLDDPNVGAAVYGIVPETEAVKTLDSEMNHPDSILTRLRALKAEYFEKKPFFVVIESGELYRPFIWECRRAGIPTFEAADVASRTLSKMAKALSMP
eukprot:TRINITY_DN16716_c0_g1_i1.p1 TRINITY_DN16716_c0_g1~~TRINITY_DN16716_c0_g1_i1.p1  ORF type:complete len:823 (-),score=332.00 TRINITY_DN16716_c0_g1_i1:881-3349(-)